jgi:acetyl esterase
VGNTQKPDDRLVREPANAARVPIVFVDFTPAPEAQYPTQNKQALAALRWVAEHGADIEIDPLRIAVAGDRRSDQAG